MLTGFVLRAQSRMNDQAHRRAELDLQINLLAEQELTAILRVLCAVGDKAGIDVARCDPRVEQFRSQTDVRAIAAVLDASAGGWLTPDSQHGLTRGGSNGRLRDKYNVRDSDGQGSSRMQGAADERDGKLYFHGTVNTQAEANKIWDAIKTVPDWPKDVVADIKASSGATTERLTPSSQAIR